MRAHEYETMHAAELGHWWFRGRRRVLTDLLRIVAGSRSGTLRILDYGCGTGGNISAYTSLGKVVGVEPDAVAIRLASTRGGGQFCRGSGTELPFASNLFDAVVASDVLEHIEHDRTAVSEIARVLRPHGAAVVSVPAHPWLFSHHDAALHHFRRYSKSGLRAVLEESGLKIRLISYWNATLFPAICLHRLASKRRRIDHPHSDISSTSWLLNEALTALLAAEGAALRRFSLPWGLSVVAVADRV